MKNKMVMLLLDEMPDDCTQCHRFFFNGICKAENKEIPWEDITKCKRPKFCQLKYVPEEKNLENLNGLSTIMHATGWNDCVKEVKKKKRVRR